MGVEFIGMIFTQPVSEIHPPKGAVIDPEYVRRFSRAHEDADFNRILIGYFSNGPDGCFLDGCPWDAIEMIPIEDVESTLEIKFQI